MSIAEKLDQYFETTFPNANTTVYRDLMMNLKKAMEDGALDESERLIVLLSIATSLENSSLQSWSEQQLKERDFTVEQIQEAKESAAIGGMLNVYYKFKGYVAPDANAKYGRAGLRMQSLMKPINGKQNMELMLMAVSIVNGCPSCIESHEKALMDLGVSTDKIHDLARLAATVKGLTVLSH